MRFVIVETRAVTARLHSAILASRRAIFFTGHAQLALNSLAEFCCGVLSRRKFPLEAKFKSDHFQMDRVHAGPDSSLVAG